MRRLVSAALRLAALLPLALGAALLLPGAPVHADETILVDEFWFCDVSYQNGVCETTITAGETITWDFSPSGDLHTATHCGADCNNPTGSPEFDSGPIFPSCTGSACLYSYTFETVGEYKYYCVYHPLSMRGTIIVTGGVGGVAELPDAAPVAAGRPASDGATASGLAAGAGIAAGLLVAASAGAWFVRKRLVP